MKSAVSVVKDVDPVLQVFFCNVIIFVLQNVPFNLCKAVIKEVCVKVNYLYISCHQMCIF